MRRRALLALPFAAASPGLAQTPARQASGPIAAVASFTILGDMLRQVAGPAATVQVIAGPDADAHVFQPRPSDSAALRGAALLVQNGLGFDPWFDRMARAAGHRATVVVATRGIEPLGMEGHHHHHHGGAERRTQHSVPPRRVADPHAWQDLRLGMAYVRNIADGLAAADPAGAATYRNNAAAYLARLDALDAWVRAQLATVPQERRKVVTGHDAFGYFAAAYGVAFLAPQGISTASDPSAAEVARLIRQIRAEAVTAVFIETPLGSATLDRLAREAGVRIRGRLYADALSPPDGPAPTYEAMFRHNIGLMVPAMRGDQ